MKAEERHKLKSNELAESLHELPHFIKEHGSRILTVVIVILMVLVGYNWYSRVSSATSQEEIARLQSLLAQSRTMQRNAAISAQLGRDDDADSLILRDSYDADTLANNFGILATDTSDIPIGMMALLQKAQAIRSGWLFSDRAITAEEKAAKCGQAESLYNEILSKYAGNALACGMAKMGLGLVAEERGDWDKAREIYSEIAADEDGMLAGTVFPRQGQARIDKLEKINISIEFPPAPLEADNPDAAAEAITIDLAQPSGNDNVDQAVDDSSGDVTVGGTSTDEATTTQ